MTLTLQVTPHYVKALEKEKQVLESQLRDLEWRMDQESKVRDQLCLDIINTRFVKNICRVNREHILFQSIHQTAWLMKTEASMRVSS